VLIVDGDPQFNATRYLLEEERLAGAGRPRARASAKLRKRRRRFDAPGVFVSGEEVCYVLRAMI
jgi:hypothetical protein